MLYRFEGILIAHETLILQKPTVIWTGVRLIWAKLIFKSLKKHLSLAGQSVTDYHK